MARHLAPQQAALYAAEAETIDALGIRWRRVADAQRSLDALVGSAWFGELWPHFVHATIERRGSGAVWSTCIPLDSDGPEGRPTEGAILVAGDLRQPVVLHELSHLLLPPDVGHGPAFAETMLTIVRHEMGFVAFAEYLHALRRREPFRSVRERIA